MKTRRITFRLYPNKFQEAQLHCWRKLHKDLYNAALYNRKCSYQRMGKKVDYYEQQNSLPEFKEYWPEYKELGSQALQATVKRVDFAFQRFFQGLGGYPKFKSSRFYRGWTYPSASGWEAQTTGKNGHLKLNNLGVIQMRGEARTWGKPTTCTIIWKGGNWYASITVNCEPARQTGTGAIGLDFGCKTAVSGAIYQGEKEFTPLVVENPRHLKQLEQDIKKAEKAKRRKQSPQYKGKARRKASSRWKKATKKVSQLKRKAANQRQDFVHKVATQIVSANSLVATEKLNLKGMTRAAKTSKGRKQKAGLNKSILDVGMGMFRQALEYKLEEAGGLFVEVPTQKIKPSQTCPQCLNKVPKTLDERTHHCTKCGYEADRDFAAAMVMVMYALGFEGLGTSPYIRGAEVPTVVPKVKHCGGFRQTLAVKRETLSDNGQ